MSSAVIGALRVNLGLNSAQFSNGLGNANKGLKRFKVAAAAAVAGAAVAFARLTTNGLQFVDAQAKLARSLDASIDGLRTLQIVASDAGVSGSALKTSLEKLTQRLAEAERKAGASRDALDRLGVSAAELSALDVDERMEAISDRIKELGWSAGQTGDFLRDLGIRNQEMALLIGAGGDAIRAARQEVIDYGLSLNAVDAAKVEAANDALSRVGRVFEGLSNQLAIAFSPALERAAESFTNLSRIGGPINRVFTALGENIGRIATIAATAAALFSGSFVYGLAAAAVSTASLSGALLVLRGALIRTGFGAVIVFAGEAVYQFNQLIETTGSLGNVMKLFGDLAKEVWDRFVIRLDIVKTRFEIFGLNLKKIWQDVLAFLGSKFAAFTSKVAPIFNQLSERIGSATRIDSIGIDAWASAMQHASSNTVAQIENLKGSIASLNEQASAPMQAFTDAVIRAREETKGTTSAVDRMNEAFGELEDPESDSGSGGGGGSGGGAGALDKIAEAAARAKDKLDDVADTATSFAENVGSSIGNAFSGAFDGLIEGTFNAREALSNLASDLAKMAANAIFQQLLGGLGGAGGGGVLDGLIGAFGGARATGGPVSAGKAYLVGERGPEVVVPRGAGQVIPNGQLRSSPGMQAAAPKVDITNIVVTDESRMGEYLQAGPGKRILVTEVQKQLAARG